MSAQTVLVLFCSVQECHEAFLDRRVTSKVKLRSSASELGWKSSRIEGSHGQFFDQCPTHDANPSPKKASAQVVDRSFLAGDNPLLTIEDVAKLYNVSISTIRRRIKDGTLKTYRIGSAVRVDAADALAAFRGGSK